MYLYRPQAVSGTVARAFCPPVHDVILFEAHEINVGVRVSSYAKDEIRIVIEFVIPDNHVVEIIDRTVEIYSSASNRSQGTLSGIKWVSLSRTEEITLDKPLQGRTEKKLFLFRQTTLSGKTNHAYYLLKVNMEKLDEDEFYLELPRFTVNGVASNLPVIKYVKDKEFVVVGINC